jgi:CHAD domain-containing protein
MAASTRSRAYRLKKHESPAAGIRRVVAGRADHALDRLKDGESDPVEAVHEARKDTKKLRSVLRLVRDPLGDSLYRRENDRFRGAARNLADVRDAQVRGETLAAVRERFTGDPENLNARDWEALESGLGSAGEPPSELCEAMKDTASEIEEGLERVDEWPLDGDGGFDLFEDGLRRAYRRGRKRFADAQESPTVGRLHEWRKRTKDLWYHLRLLRVAWPPVMEALAGEAHELSDHLGDDHDLALLRASAKERIAGDAPKRFERLERLIARRRSELQEQAFTLGEHIYAEKPKPFTKRIEKLWVAKRV